MINIAGGTGVGAEADGRVWFKSSRSQHNGCCVEVAMEPGYVAVRDSTRPDAEMLRFGAHSWSHFLSGIAAGQFDLPDRH